MTRGYGAAMHRLLMRIQDGESWQTLSTGLFGGQGSYGNGAAMRVAPLGAYFADDLDKVIEQSRLSAEVTHAHDEGIIGAVATAVAAAIAWGLRQKQERPTRKEFVDLVMEHVPSSLVRERLRHARNLAPGASMTLAIPALGNGSEISAQDTVPFVVWAAGEFLDNYEEAIWQTVSVSGDIDTNAAMVGGIVAAYTGIENIPSAWIEAREPLPAWTFEG